MAEDAEVPFQQLMDAAPVMIWVSGPDKLCTWFNKPWLEFTGRTMAEELGDGWIIGVHPEDAGRCHADYVANFDKRLPFRLEYRLRRADGEYRWILDTGVPRYGADGEFRGYIGSCIDINAMKAAELGLQSSLVGREAALESLERVAAGMAHEFSNLIGAFVADLWFIRTHANDPASVRRRAEEAEEAAVRGGHMIEQLLASVGRHRRPETVRVNRLIADAATILRGAAGERASMETNLAAAHDEVMLEPAHLQAALLNLVTNARDAMPRGGTVTIKTANVTMRAESVDEPDLSPGRYLVLLVSDTGTGMSQEVMQRALEPFFTTKEAGRGTGLGLSQVRAFAKHSGGAVRIESVPSRGTTVRIYLPQSAKPEA